MSETKSSTKRKVEPDDRFGRLVVVREAEKVKGRRRVWVRCDCGVEKSVRPDCLGRGTTLSCGCLGIERRRAATKISNRTHGRCKTPDYARWQGMIKRCYQESHPSYPRYGGRGISVVDEWRGRGGFERFMSHIGERPSAAHSIDRIDNDGNYQPGNVRWATRSEQARNRSSNRLLTHDGRAECVAEWSETTGLRQSTIRERIRRGWSVENALTTPTNT